MSSRNTAFGPNLHKSKESNIKVPGNVFLPAEKYEIKVARCSSITNK